MHLIMGSGTSLSCHLALLPLNVARSHWIRWFATDAPIRVILSSELEGSDIEYYYRQNGEIADYDLMRALLE